MNGKTLGDYDIIKRIGQGSLGTVYLAEHRYMKKKYALKVLPEELSKDRTFIQRFEEEVGVLASLDHPNLVKIHNISYAEGHYFLVTDCIVDEMGETTNLAQYLVGQNGKIEEENLYHILEQVALALDYIHTKTLNNLPLVHRGIKMNNILVGKGTKRPKVFVSDCGLSRIIGVGAVLTRIYKSVAESLGMSRIMSQTIGNDQYQSEALDTEKVAKLHASFLQSFAFLSPEQKKIDTKVSVDIQTDTYSFGVLVYYLLTGLFPEGMIKMPSKITSGYKYDWDGLVWRCLQMFPEKRPTKLKEALEEVLTEGVSRNQHIAQSSGISSSADSLAKPFIKQTGPVQLQLNIPMNDSKSSLNTLSESKTTTQVFEQVKQNHNPLKPFEIPKTKAPWQVTEEKTIQTVTAEQKVVARSGENEILKPVLNNSLLERPMIDPNPASAFIVDPVVKQYIPEPREIKDIQPILTDMVVIKGGSFYRGSNDGNRDEKPRHQVHLRSFAMDIHPVTNEQFVLFLEAMGGEKDHNHQDLIILKESRITKRSGKLCIESGYSKHPVVGVTWFGAVAYAKWVGKRLPTEAEWEIAARGNNEDALYPTGDDIEKTQANFFSSDTTAVMSYPSNGYGLYDMSGNVYEWCSDWYDYNAYELAAQEPDNPKGPMQGVYRVLRGGCWKSLKEDLRCSKRHRNKPTVVNATYGFRCATDTKED